MVPEGEVRLKSDDFGFSINFQLEHQSDSPIFFLLETLGDLPIVPLSPIKSLVQSPKITPMILEQGTLVGVCSERCRYSK